MAAAMEKEMKEKPMLETLNFLIDSSKSTAERDNTSFQIGSSAKKEIKPLTPEEEVCCLFCSELYNLESRRNDFLKHLVLQHKIVIADAKLIANFKKYIDYWREKFRDKPLTEYCTVIQTNSDKADLAPSEYFYLLCDVLPEDKDLRVKLQKEKLKAVLVQQQIEREVECVTRRCLFCREHFDNNRSDVFNHMAYEHNFSVGQPDNLVYADEFLQLLETKLQNLECLYCEKTFKDRHVLKEHMRKKQHKKLNPRNTAYDKFFIINYLELGKSWQELQQEPSAAADEEEEDADSSHEDDWGDWKEECGAGAVCLFCDHASCQPESLMGHMKDIHTFDIENIKQELDLSFYQQIKLINYIRRQVHQKKCTLCDEVFPSRDSLLDHMNFTGHLSRLPDISVWDQPQYYFPTYENDNLLCALGDEGDCDVGPTGVMSTDNVVIAEEVAEIKSVLEESDLRKEILWS